MLQARATQLTAADATNLTLHVEMVAYNPNPFPVLAQGASAAVSLQGTPLGNVNANLMQELPPQQWLPVAVNVTVPRNIVVLPEPSSPEGYAFTVNGSVYFQGPRRGIIVTPYALHGVVPPQALVASAAPQPVQQGTMVQSSGGAATGM
jgi:hypothetical protein